jgi:hypothetical protein
MSAPTEIAGSAGGPPVLNFDFIVSDLSFLERTPEKNIDGSLKRNMSVLILSPSPQRKIVHSAPTPELSKIRDR